MAKTLLAQQQIRMGHMRMKVCYIYYMKLILYLYTNTGSICKHKYFLYFKFYELQGGGGRGGLPPGAMGGGMRAPIPGGGTGGNRGKYIGNSHFNI